VELLGQPVLDQGLTTPVVGDEATQSVEEVVLPSLSRKESDLVLVRDQPQVELSVVAAFVLRPGSVTSTVPDETAGHESESLDAHSRVPLQEACVSSSDREGDEPIRMLTNTEIQIKNEGGDIIIISSPETDDRQSASSDITALRRELLTLRGQSRSHQIGRGTRESSHRKRNKIAGEDGRMWGLATSHGHLYRRGPQGAKIPLCGHVPCYASSVTPRVGQMFCLLNFVIRSSSSVNCVK